MILRKITPVMKLSYPASWAAPDSAAVAVAVLPLPSAEIPTTPSRAVTSEAVEAKLVPVMRVTGANCFQSTETARTADDALLLLELEEEEEEEEEEDDAGGRTVS